MKKIQAGMRNLWVIGAVCLVLLASGCLEQPGGGTLTPDDSSPAAPDAWIVVYFTDPKSPQAAKYRGGPDEQLAAAIDQARVSVDIAAYDLNLWSLRDALVRAGRRGVTVRMVVESDNLDEPEIQDLKEAGIPILGDRRDALPIAGPRTPA